MPRPAAERGLERVTAGRIVFGEDGEPVQVEEVSPGLFDRDGCGLLLWGNAPQQSPRRLDTPSIYLLARSARSDGLANAVRGLVTVTNAQVAYGRSECGVFHLKPSDQAPNDSTTASRPRVANGCTRVMLGPNAAQSALAETFAQV